MSSCRLHLVEGGRAKEEEGMKEREGKVRREGEKGAREGRGMKGRRTRE